MYVCLQQIKARFTSAWRLCPIARSKFVLRRMLWRGTGASLLLAVITAYWRQLRMEDVKQ